MPNIANELLASLSECEGGLRVGLARVLVDA